jgi:aldehyde dehydrogenase (NAD+)
MGYINSGKKDGATVHVGGERHGKEGYFIQPTIFTNCTPEMKIMKEEIFGPVAAVVKFKTEKGRSLVFAVQFKFLLLTLVLVSEIEVIEAANATVYGLGCHVFSENLSRALRVAHQVEAGTAWVHIAFSVWIRVVMFNISFLPR